MFLRRKIFTIFLGYIISIFVIKMIYSSRVTNEHEKDILLNKFSEITEFDVPIHWDLVGLNQNDAKLIAAIRTKVLWQPPNPKKILNLKHDIKSDGQTTQSLYVENLLKHHNLWNSTENTGFFIEAGASGGEVLSNTLYFEKKFNWTGLLVEPNPYWWKELKSKNRNAWILPHCLSTDKKVQVIDFYAFSTTNDVKLMGTEFGFSSHNADELKFDEKFYEKNSDSLKKIKVQCFPLQAILKAMNLPIVNYFSLDIEGPEYEVLKTLEFSKLSDILVLGVEIIPSAVQIVFRKKSKVSRKKQIHDYMKQNGYEFTDTVDIANNFFVKNHNKISSL